MNFIVEPVGSASDPFSLIDQYEPLLNFTESEEERGLYGLKKLGITKNEKFVCLIARDPSYLNQNNPNKDYSYHDYRNHDINDFLLAAEHLTSKGYFVIRMGNIAEKKFRSANPKIIDYSFSNFKSDFMDIYLGAKCSFCITTQTGFDGVPQIFRKPLAVIAVPVAIRISYKKVIFITKHHICNKTNKEITLSEILKMSSFKKQ